MLPGGSIFSPLIVAPTKSEGYSFGAVRVCVRLSVRPSGTIFQYLLVRINSFLVQMIGTTDS